MGARLRIALVSAGTAAVTAAAVLGAAAPASAKSETWLSAPRVVHARDVFLLTAWVGDDSGARPALVRLQVLGAHRRYQWLGQWQELHRTDHWDESSVFMLAEDHRGTVTFRAVVSDGYAVTSPVTVLVVR
jgi:hypothetical protein